MSKAPKAFKIKAFIDNIVRLQNEELLRQISQDTGKDFKELCNKYLQPTFYSIDLEGINLNIDDSYYEKLINANKK